MNVMTDFKIHFNIFEVFVMKYFDSSLHLHDGRWIFLSCSGSGGMYLDLLVFVVMCQKRLLAHAHVHTQTQVNVLQCTWTSIVFYVLKTACQYPWCKYFTVYTLSKEKQRIFVCDWVGFNKVNDVIFMFMLDYLGACKVIQIVNLLAS